jgi:hypothetical protein
MADEFDRFLESALAPPERSPDRRFVARVQAVIALEERLAAERRSMAAALGKQLLGLVAVSSAAVWIVRVAPVASWFDQSPSAGLAILLVGFGFLVAMFARPGSEDQAVSPH